MDHISKTNYPLNTEILWPSTVLKTYYFLENNLILCVFVVASMNRNIQKIPYIPKTTNQIASKNYRERKKNINNL